MAHIFDVGTRAWQPDTAEGWVASEVTDKQIDGDKVTLVFTLETGEVRTPTCSQAQCLLHMTADYVRCRRRPSRPPWKPSRMATTPTFRL